MSIVTRCGAIAAIVTGVFVAPVQAVELRMLTSWDDSYSIMKDIPQPFMEMVKEASGGEIAISAIGPESVPPFEQLQPVSAGVFDLLFTHGTYHTGVTGIGSAADALDPDPDKRRESGAWDWIDRHYQEQHNLKLISLPTAPTGYQIYVRKPLDEDGMLTGRKLRGVQSYSGVFKLLGATTVILPPGEVYSSIEKGVIDGVGWPSVGSLGFKFYEVAPYVVRPTFGAVSYMLFMNADSFKSLSPENQKILLDMGYRLEKHTNERFRQLLAEEDAELVKHGVTITTNSKVGAEALAKAYADEAWAIAAKTPGDDAKEFYRFAKEHGVTP